jgi:hypothetical protein
MDVAAVSDTATIPNPITNSDRAIEINEYRNSVFMCESSQAYG